ncbi:MAG: hypothetical protein HRU08_00950 [Oleispira sp.]|nr:hypothetical protein [Oleispira sp.]
MAKIIPSLSSCVRKMTSGEKRFGRRLESLLEDGYLCWFDIPLGKNRWLIVETLTTSFYIPSVACYS